MSEIFNPDVDMTTVGVPYIIHESHMARLERANKRLAIICMSLIVALLLLTALGVYERLQYDYTSEEYVYQQDGEGLNIIGDSNEVNNGSESYNSQEEANS